MKIRAIRLENVRRFVDPVEIAGIGDGLNVLTAPNERGKSTFFDALYAVFFKDRKSWDKEIRSLVPYAGGDPAVAVEIELPEGVFRIEKRWNSRRSGEAKITSAGRLIKQADDAQAWIADTLKSPKDGGPAGLLWVRQGQSGLGEGDNTHRVRRDLMTSVAGEVEAMTGGRRMDMARDMCRKELDRYLTATRRVKSDGPLKRAEDDAAKLREKREELEKKCNELRRELDQRKEFRRELAELVNPEEEEARKRRLAEAEATHAEAGRHHEALERALEIERARGVDRDRAAEKLEILVNTLVELEAAHAALAAAQDEEGRSKSEVRAAASKVSDAARAHEAARKSTEAAADVLQRTLRVQASVSAAYRRKELNEQLRRAEKLRQQTEQASADAKKEISDLCLTDIERLDEDLRVMKRTRDLEAATITMQYAPGLQDGISLDGVALPDRETTPIPDGAGLDIDNLGRLAIHPGRKASDGSLAEGEAKLAAALEAAGLKSMAEARESALRRCQAEERGRDAQAALRGVAPKGIEALREQIASLPEPMEEQDDLPTVEEAQESEAAARVALTTASERLEACRLELGDAQTKAARAAAAVESAEGRRSRADAQVAGIDDPEAARSRLKTEVCELTSARTEATRRREEIAAMAPDLDAAQTALERAQSIMHRADKDRQRIRVELGKLDTMIDLLAGEAVEEELSDVVMRVGGAERVLDELKFEIAVLGKLEGALEDARASARDRYVEPVLAELEPLVRLLWPEAVLHIDAEEVLPTALKRSGTEEEFEVLSAGTQEQIALLVRLAFARMLARSGVPAPVILDDAIVFTDDDRIERMFDALRRQAQDLQIMVLSCRQRAFRDLGGRGLQIVPVGSQN